jgi:proline dehydrogenase
MAAPLTGLATPGSDELEPAALEREIALLGRQLAQSMRRAGYHPAALAERQLMGLLMSRPALRASLLRFVDVRPACSDEDDVARHLADLLADADTDSEGDGEPSTLSRLVTTAVRRPRSRAATAEIAAGAVRQIAGRFIVGGDPHGALAGIERLWLSGVAASVDLLGEATVTEAEADRYAARCHEALHTLHAAAPRWPARPLLETDGIGPLPRVNLSVKVSALTPLLRPTAPERGIEGGEQRLRALLREARDLGAHLHIDMESFDSREAVTDLTLGLLGEEEFAAGPSAGVVLQAYLTESPQHLESLLEWAERTPRAAPLTVRLVKGAYWDHEVVQARQHGWSAPVFTDRPACDRNFESLTRRLIDRLPLLRVAIASHNLRSIAHAAAYAQARGHDAGDIEFQVLRGLGDLAQHAVAASGRRVRCYCPVGDQVAGMAYLVRRLLENTSNDSFLAAQAHGTAIDALLAPP